MVDRVILVINKIDWTLAERVIWAMKFRFPLIEFALASTSSTICISALNIPPEGMLTFLGVQIFGEGILTGMNILQDYKEWQKFQSN